MTKITYIIAITEQIEEEFPYDSTFDEIGRFLAEDIEHIYDNGEESIETEYLGCKIT